MPSAVLSNATPPANTPAGGSALPVRAARPKGRPPGRRCLMALPSGNLDDFTDGSDENGLPSGNKSDFPDGSDENGLPSGNHSKSVPGLFIFVRSSTLLLQ